MVANKRDGETNFFRRGFSVQCELEAMGDLPLDAVSRLSFDPSSKMIGHAEYK